MALRQSQAPPVCKAIRRIATQRGNVISKLLLFTRYSFHKLLIGEHRAISRNYQGIAGRRKSATRPDAGGLPRCAELRFCFCCLLWIWTKLKKHCFDTYNGCNDFQKNHVMCKQYTIRSWRGEKRRDGDPIVLSSFCRRHFTTCQAVSANKTAKYCLQFRAYLSITPDYLFITSSHAT